MINDVGATTLIHLNIRSLREKNGLTQEQVADFLNMSVNGYGDIERGETDIKFSRLVQIADLFNIPLAVLVIPNLNPYEHTLKEINQQHDISISKYSKNQYLAINNTEMYKLIIDLKDNEISLLRKMISLLESKQ